MKPLNQSEKNVVYALINNDVEFIVDHHLDFNKHYFDKYPLIHLTILLNRSKIFINQFIVNGANINEQDFIGHTPLHLAIILRDKAAISLLLNENCDDKIKDQYGNQPFDYIIDDEIKTLIQSKLNTLIPIEQKPWYAFYEFPKNNRHFINNIKKIKSLKNLNQTFKEINLTHMNQHINSIDDLKELCDLIQLNYDLIHPSCFNNHNYDLYSLPIPIIHPYAYYSELIHNITGLNTDDFDDVMTEKKYLVLQSKSHRYQIGQVLALSHEDSKNKVVLKTGPKAIYQYLSEINIDNKITLLEDLLSINNSKCIKKQITVLKLFKQNNLQLTDIFIDKIPIYAPMYHYGVIYQSLINQYNSIFSLIKKHQDIQFVYSNFFRIMIAIKDCLMLTIGKQKFQFRKIRNHFYLKNYEKEINKFNDSYLTIPTLASQKDYKIIKNLLNYQKYKKENMEFLKYLIDENQINLLSQLLDDGFTINGLFYNIEKGSYETLLTYALRKKAFNIVKLLIKKGACLIHLIQTFKSPLEISMELNIELLNYIEYPFKNEDISTVIYYSIKHDVKKYSDKNRIHFNQEEIKQLFNKIRKIIEKG